MSRELILIDPRIYARTWQDLTGHSEEEWKAPLLEGLPERTKLTLKHRGGKAFNMIFSRADPATRLYDIYFEYMVADNCMTLIGADVSARGTNTAGLIARKALRVADEMDVREMMVYATEIGAYVWGRSAFTPDADSWQSSRIGISRHLNKLLSAGENISNTSIERIRAAVKSDDPRAFWTVIDTRDEVQDSKLGIVLSKNTSWAGFCNLQDHTYRDRYIAYAMGQPLPEWPPQPATHQFNTTSAQQWRKCLARITRQPRYTLAMSPA